MWVSKNDDMLRIARSDLYWKYRKPQPCHAEASVMKQ